MIKRTTMRYLGSALAALGIGYPLLQQKQVADNSDLQREIVREADTGLDQKTEAKLMAAFTKAGSSDLNDAKVMQVLSIYEVQPGFSTRMGTKDTLEYNWTSWNDFHGRLKDGWGTQDARLNFKQPGGGWIGSYKGLEAAREKFGNGQRMVMRVEPN